MNTISQINNLITEMGLLPYFKEIIEVNLMIINLIKINYKLLINFDKKFEEV